MTTTIRAAVFRVPRFPWNDTDTPSWRAMVYLDRTEGDERARLERAASWPEAMQAAQKLRADLDAELMAEVHESRAQRREARTEDPYTMEATA
ncbi:MAG: hypothetical protein QM606_05800 [Leucobacter sp.]